MYKWLIKKQIAFVSFIDIIGLKIIIKIATKHRKNRLLRVATGELNFQANRFYNCTKSKILKRIATKIIEH